MGSSKSKKRFGRKRKIPKIADCSFAVIVSSYLGLCLTSCSSTFTEKSPK